MIELILHRYKIKKFRDQRILIQLIHRYKIKKLKDQRIVTGLVVYLYKSKKLYQQ